MLRSSPSCLSYPTRLSFRSILSFLSFHSHPMLQTIQMHLSCLNCPKRQWLPKLPSCRLRLMHQMLR